jgi:hypothetical protein
LTLGSGANPSSANLSFPSLPPGKYNVLVLVQSYLPYVATLTI